MKQFSDDYFDDKFFGKEPFKGAARGKKSPFDVFFNNKIMKIFPDKNISIFVVGCGMGWRAQTLYEKGYKNIVACDISKYAVENTVFEGKVFVCDVTKLDTSQKFDLVICNRVLGYLEPGGIERAIKNLKEVTNKYLILSIITKDHKSDWVKKVALNSRRELYSKQFYLDLFKKYNLKIDEEKTDKMINPEGWDNIWVLKNEY